MSEHTAKRQRLDSTGRFSPASPPFDVAAKASGHTKTPIHPRTPTSPDYPSMTSQAVGGFATISAASQHLFPTPASTAGVFSAAAMDSDGDAPMEDSTDDDHRASNHERHRQLEFSAKGGLKAAEGISGDQLFRVARRRCDMSRPHGSQNLFHMYSLESLARSVARTDPVTGEKINKLRKSYEGHIKQMQIAGKPKAQKMDGVFSIPASIPEDHWHEMKVKGKEIDASLTPTGTALNADFSGLLDGAFAGMAPGALPTADSARYRTYIGTDDVVKPKAQDGPSHRTTPLTSAAPTPGHLAGHRGAVRPERAGSKRHYTDAAFQGYGEGYGDEFGADSTGGEDNTQGNMAKRRKLQFERAPHSVEVGGVRR
jgi:hypothetical protein